MSHTNTVLGFWDFSMFYQIFLSSQGEQSIIISNKNGIKVASETATKPRILEKQVICEYLNCMNY